MIATGSALFGGEGAAEVLIQGFIGREDVRSVEVRFESEGNLEAVDATVERLPDDLVRIAGGRPPLGYFIAFLPAGETPSEVFAVAFSEDGTQLGSPSLWRSDPGAGSEIDVEVGPEGEAGKAVASQVGCLACHSFGNSGNQGPGPDLTHIGSALTRAEIAAAVAGGPKIMPSYAALAEEEPRRFEDLIDFLVALE